MSRIPYRSILPLAALLAACTEPDAITSVSRLEAPALSSATIGVVMSGLNSPRGLGWGPEGALYVAEAGAAITTGYCAEVMEGNTPATRCYSGTGSISRLWKGRQERTVTGLPSSYFVQSGFSSGPQDISFHGRGNALVPLGWGGPPQLRADFGPDAAALGTLAKVTPGGAWKVVADIAGFEQDWNPAGGPVDSNPYGALAEGDRTFVVDAGGNSLLEVAANGDITLVATFPSTPAIPPFMQSESVPTKVRRGPDGALYVSTLTGVPFQAGTARIYRVVPGAAPQVHATGFKTITDFAFAADGTMYVVQFATDFVFFGGPGALIRVAPDGTRTVVTTALFQPTGVIAGDDGSVYVSNKGTLTGQGEVLRIVP